MDNMESSLKPLLSDPLQRPLEVHTCGILHMDITYFRNHIAFIVMSEFELTDMLSIWH